MGGECNHLLSYLMDELNEKEKTKFIEHLQHCQECSKEYEKMTDAWNSLQLDFEEKEIPATLKMEVMDFVFNNNRETLRAKLAYWGTFLQKQFTPVTTVSILVLIGVIFTLTFSNVELRHVLRESEEINALPIEVLSTLSLQPTDQASGDSNGYAFILKKGEAKDLVVQVNNLPPLEGSEVYQVWLLKNGERTNAGIFKPNEHGAGMLTYPIAQSVQFDQIGITLEPDQYSNEPKGKKVIGTL